VLAGSGAGGGRLERVTDLVTALLMNDSADIPADLTERFTLRDEP